MSNTLEVVTVNKKQEYHNCEIVFCFFYESQKSDFSVKRDQKYSIHTTLDEVELLNEALNIYQSDNFKEKYLLYSAEIDGRAKYPEFEPLLKKSQEVVKELTQLANDEDSLVQLTEYCLEVAPTYYDDFGINKDIESIRVGSSTKQVRGYEDIKSFIQEFKK